jgi:peroxiredoxin
MLIGVLALVLLIAFSVSRLTTHHVGTIGVPAGVRLRWFAAPLAGSSLVGDANVNPPCTIQRHDPRALNDCLLAQRAPLVLAFFATGSPACVRQVDTLQAVSLRFRGSLVQFAAVAVRTGPAAARAVLRSHGWQIPVAYDRDGAVGALYGVAVCPLLELARRGGIVVERLIGERWLNAAALGARVQRLLSG